MSLSSTLATFPCHPEETVPEPPALADIPQVIWRACTKPECHRYYRIHLTFTGFEYGMVKWAFSEVPR